MTAHDLPSLIGLNGRARSGKDTAANFLVKNYGYEKVAWADVLRDCARAVNPIIGHQVWWRGGLPVRWAHLYDDLGYEAAKDHPVFGPEFRRVLLTMGTEMGRNILGEDTWVNALLNRLDPGKRYVFADTRFVNEASAVTERGGAVLRILRNGLPQIDHPSETGLDLWEFDAVVINNGTLDDFYNELQLALSKFSEVRLPS